MGDLFSRNATQDYVLQRLTERTYWVQRQYYATVFYVGSEGVLLFDPLDGGAAHLKQAIASVTNLPVRAIVYSHNHNDHIGSAKEFTSNGQHGPIRVIASERTIAQQRFLKSSHPEPTEAIPWPNGSFEFEGVTVELHGLERAAHAEDHAVWLLQGESVAHIPDLINPDQPPFWSFGGSEGFLYYEHNIEQVGKLTWDYLCGGHGNVGSRADLDFYRQFIADLKGEVGKAMASVKWGTGVDASKLNAHTAFLPGWLDAVSAKATEGLRSKYGRYYGFDAATPRNAEMVAMTLFDYR